MVSKRHELTVTPILKVELFNVWGIDFMGPFVCTFGNKYIFVSVHYVSMWVNGVALQNNEGKNVVEFLKCYNLLDLVCFGISLVMVDPIFAIPGSQLH